MANLFQTRLFGYAKASVNNYISKLNEEFSNKLLANEKEHKIAQEALQAEIKRLTAENAQLLAARQEVAEALICAQDYAASLKQQTEAEEQAQREQNTARQMTEFRRIQSIASHIQKLHEEFHSVLMQMDHELETYTVECGSLQSELMEQTENAAAKKEGMVCIDTTES